MTVAGIFEIGMWEFDMGFVVASLWEARDFCGGAGLEAIQVMTDDPYAAEAVAAELRARLGPDVRVSTWMEQNRQLFAALRVEKNMMFFLLIFITIVAAFGITNTLITVTVQKTREIGLLRSLGFSSGSDHAGLLLAGLDRRGAGHDAGHRDGPGGAEVPERPAAAS